MPIQRFLSNGSILWFLSRLQTWLRRGVAISKLISKLSKFNFKGHQPWNNFYSKLFSVKNWNRGRFSVSHKAFKWHKCDFKRFECMLGILPRTKHCETKFLPSIYWHFHLFKDFSLQRSTSKINLNSWKTGQINVNKLIRGQVFAYFRRSLFARLIH